MVKVLVIGATGYLGLSIAQALRRASFTVYGLTRSRAKSHLLAANEIIPIVGSGEEPQSYLTTLVAENIDIVIDASATYQGAHDILQSLLGAGKTRLQAAVGGSSGSSGSSSSGRSPKLGYIYISGMWIHGDSQRPVNDLDPVGRPQSVAQPPRMLSWRPALEAEILAAGEEALNVAIVRPACMYGKNQSAFGAYWGPILGAAHAPAPAATLDLAATSEAMMALVHVEDCAEGVVAVADNLELLAAPGLYPVFDLMGSYENMGVLMTQAARILGFEGALHFTGPGSDAFAEAMCAGVKGDSHRARALLGWVPRRKPLVEELEIHLKAFLASLE